MKGQDVIDFIKENNLEEAIVTVTATMYYNGDHDCRTTQEVSISSRITYVRIETSKRSKFIEKPTIDFYVDLELY